MSSLAAARADNFYYPPDYDPSKYTSIKKKLGIKKVNKDDKLILVRFEIPFRTQCEKCKCYIDKGVRYNARRKCVGHYHTTEIIEFSMDCKQCRNVLIIKTDPKNTEYICHEGLRRINRENKDNQIIDQEDITKRRGNAMLQLEHTADFRKTRIISENKRINELLEINQDTCADSFTNNQILRNKLRNDKKIDKDIKKRIDKGDNFELPILKLTEQDEDIVKDVKFIKKNIKINKINNKRPIIGKLNQIELNKRIKRNNLLATRSRDRLFNKSASIAM